MTETKVVEALGPLVPQPAERKVVSVPGADGKVKKIRGRLLKALDLMIWGGPDGRPVNWEEAGPLAGLTTRAMRKALQKPHVRYHIASEKRICRDAVGAANVQVARLLRDTAENSMTRMHALRYLDGAVDERPEPARTLVTPGVVVHVNLNREPRADLDEIIEINPIYDEK